MHSPEQESALAKQFSSPQIRGDGFPWGIWLLSVREGAEEVRRIKRPGNSLSDEGVKGQ
jgi:hypothetical protein